jgi:aminodeoxyfutalosine deaminase
MAVSLQARVVFPVDQPPIERGVVTIEGTRIVEVGKQRGGDLTDLGSVALFPGLVNAHTHLEFSNLRQPLGKPGISLVEWIRQVIAQRGRNDKWDSTALTNGYSESIGWGATTIGNISTSFSAVSGDICNFLEVIGFSRARAESALLVIAKHFDLHSRVRKEHPSVAQVLDESAQYGISPHAPYTVSPKLMSELVLLANRYKLPMAMHVAESQDELELLRTGTGPFQSLLEERSMWDAEAIPKGSRALNYLEMLADAPRALIIHGNYLVDEELTFLATNRDRMSLVYCPRTHTFFAHQPYPLSRALTEGVRVALGTDSRASNPDLDLLAEMRFAARAHPTVDPQEILRMGTLAGAEALGRESDVGSLTPGKLANMIAVRLPEEMQDGPDAALESVLFGEELVSTVWLRRKVWVKAGG